MTSSLTIGSFASGSYSLSSPGQLSAPTESIGDGSQGGGSFTQTGGTNSVTGFSGLTVGNNGHGTYNLSAGLLAAQSETVGLNGTGTVNQSGGLNSVPLGNLTLGMNCRRQRNV